MSRFRSISDVSARLGPRAAAMAEKAMAVKGKPVSVKKPPSTEVRMAKRLAFLKLGGLIIDWIAQPDSIELCSGCKYTPDFLVEVYDRGRLRRVYIECKGEWIHNRGARIRFLWAAQRWGGTGNSGAVFIWSQWAAKRGGKAKWHHQIWAAFGRFGDSGWLKNSGLLEG